MTQQELEKNIVLEYNDGSTMADIQRKYNIGYKKVRNTLMKNNITIRNIKDAKNKQNMRILTLEEEKLVCDTYRNTNRVKDCQLIIHSGQEVVKRCLQKYGLYKTQKETVTQNNIKRRKYEVRDDFFDIETSEMAYILGFIAADGTVRKDSNEIKIGLSAKDAELLEKFKAYIGGRDLKYYTTQDGFDVVSWCFCSQHIKEKLSEYNIIPQKTFTFKFPQKLQKKYWIDFIRGYFDGDGSISTAGPHAIRWQVCSATKDVLENIVNFFYEEYNIPKTTIQNTIKGRNNPLYIIQYTTTSTREIYKYLYYDNCLCLKRKKEKYEAII